MPGPNAFCAPPSDGATPHECEGNFAPTSTTRSDADHLSSPAHTSPPGQPGVRPELLELFVVLLAATFPYFVTLTYGFVYDDVGVIVDITAREGWSGLWRAWVSSYWGNPDTGLYRPLVQFIYSLLWNVGGGHAFVFHLYAILLHVGATLGVWYVLRYALTRWAALLGTLLFAVHPLHVEAVANIANSSEVMVTLLALLAVIALWRGDAHTPDGTPVGWAWAALVAGIYFLALCAKESAATIPAMVFVSWWGWNDWLGRQSESTSPRPAARVRDTLWRGWRVWSACVLALVAMFIIRRIVLHGLTVRGDWIIGELRELPFGPRFWTMTNAWPTVARILVWPAALRMHYGSDAIPLEQGATMRSIASFVVVGCALAYALLLARRADRRPLVALLWIGFAYLPASNILVPTGQLLAERTLYLASVGAVMLAAWVIDFAIAWAGITLPANRARLAVAVPVGTLVLLGAAKSTSAAIPWQDNFTLFQTGIAEAPESSHPYWLMGNLYVTKGDHRKALAYLSKAYRLDPSNAVVIFYYSRELHGTGQGEAELAVLRDAVRRLPKSEEMRVMYRIALSDMRGPDSVIADARADRATDSVAVHWQTVFIAEAFARKGMVDSALAAYRAGIEHQPGNGLVRFEYAKLLMHSGALAEADSQLTLASSAPGVKPEAVWRVRAELALARGDTAVARAALRSALTIAPADTALARLSRQLGAAPGAVVTPTPAHTTSR